MNNYTGQRHKRGAEGQHWIIGLLRVENHSMGSQVDPAHLLSLELIAVLSRKVQIDVVTEQQNTRR